MFAPGTPLLMRDLSIASAIIGTLTVSIYVLGFAIGPLFLSPLSELYGRLGIYQCCNLVFFAFTFGCALSTNVGMFLVFPFVAGCAGTAPLTIDGGTVADLFPQEKRGSVMGMLALGPIIGPVRWANRRRIYRAGHWMTMDVLGNSHYSMRTPLSSWQLPSLTSARLASSVLSHSFTCAKPMRQYF